MSYWLDLTGSYIIGGMVLLLLVNINISVSTAASENLNSSVLQRNVSGTSYFIEDDLYKAGLRATGNIFTIADSMEIKFYTDINNDGTLDEIHYICGNKNDLKTTENPNDFMLTRKLNNEKIGVSTRVSKFNLSYYDSSGQIIDYGLLKEKSYRNKINSIRINLSSESAEPIDGKYDGAEWKKTISPKNL